MQNKINTLILICAVHICTAQQNLVLNPSFEDTVYCPMNQLGAICATQYWFQPNIYWGNVCNSSSTDLIYLNCNSIITFSLLGYQLPRTGNAYVFIGTYVNVNFPNNSNKNSREYLQGTLSHALKQNKKYCIEFYISKADMSNLAIDRVGVYFTQDSLKVNQGNMYQVINIIPQFETPEFLFYTDTVNWVKVEGEFMAQGGERFFTIGNFRDSNNTNYIIVQNHGPQYDVAGYFIDDVAVYYCDEPEDSIMPLKIPNAFSPNGDGINDFYVIEGIEEYPNNELYIYNRWGELVYYKEKYDNSWNGEPLLNPPPKGGLIIGKNKLVEGTYFFVLKLNPDAEGLSGFVELRR